MGSKLSLCVQYALTQPNDEAILGGFLCTWMDVISHTINYSLLVLFTAQRQAKTIPNTPTKQQNCNNWSKLLYPVCRNPAQQDQPLSPSTPHLSLLFHPAVCLCLTLNAFSSHLALSLTRELRKKVFFLKSLNTSFLAALSVTGPQSAQ